MSLSARCTVEVTEKYWKTKYSPVGILLIIQSFPNSANASKKERATSCMQ